MAVALTLHGLTVVFFAAIGEVEAMERGAGRRGRACARIISSVLKTSALRLHMRAPRHVHDTTRMARSSTHVTSRPSHVHVMHVHVMIAFTSYSRHVHAHARPEPQFPFFCPRIER